MRKEFNRLFDKISSDMSDKELLEAALRKAENMESKKKTGIRKPIILACAAVGIVLCGVTAAATGLLGFNQIFGRTIVAESEELGYELIGDAHDVVITCSDNNYSAVLKGVTGTADSCLASIEIFRKDGGIIGDNLCYSSLDWSYISSDGEVVRGCSRYGTVVDSRIFCESVDMGMLSEETSQGESLSGKRITLEYKGIYSDKIKNPIDVTIEFTYLPSEKSMEQIELNNLEIPCEILYSIRANIENPTLPTGRDIPLDTVITGIDLRTQKGMLTGNILLEDFSFEDYSINTFMCKNDVVLIKQDGTEVPVFLGGYHVESDGDKLSFTMNIEYRNFNEQAGIAVDLTEIEAIDFNGTVYSLG